MCYSPLIMWQIPYQQIVKNILCLQPKEKKPRELKMSPNAVCWHL